MQSKLSDIELIQQTLSGNQAAYADLVKRHQRFVFTLAMRFCKGREDAEEVAQDGAIDVIGGAVNGVYDPYRLILGQQFPARLNRQFFANHSIR